MKCAICGAEFEPYRAWQKYCSAKCRKERQRRLYEQPQHRAKCREASKRWRENPANRAASNLQRKFRHMGGTLTMKRARELLAEELVVVRGGEVNEIKKPARKSAKSAEGILNGYI